MHGVEPLWLIGPDEQPLSALLNLPRAPRALLVLGHGAGAGMRHAFLEQVATGLCERGIASLRYQFAFMERGLKRTDPPAVAHAIVRTAVGEAAARCPGVPLFAGGKSFGGRMTSQAQATEPLPEVRGLVFFGFPLHPEGKPSIERADHLDGVTCPMLFLQGTRDGLADAALIASVVERLGANATLDLTPDADHAFHVRRSSGSNDAEVLRHLLDVATDWMTGIVARQAPG